MYVIACIVWRGRGASRISAWKKRRNGSRSGSWILSCAGKTGLSVTIAIIVQKRIGDVSYNIEIEMVGFSMGR
jgi:hypothetical protein